MALYADDSEIYHQERATPCNKKKEQTTSQDNAHSSSDIPDVDIFLSGMENLSLMRYIRQGTTIFRDLELNSITEVNDARSKIAFTKLDNHPKRQL